LIAQNNKLIKESEDIKRKSEEMLSKADMAYFENVKRAKEDSLLIVNNAKEQAEKELSSIASKFSELIEERKRFEDERDVAK
jgi:F0F1-type ATP synthase membrane subunit b/b'